MLLDQGKYKSRKAALCAAKATKHGLAGSPMYGLWNDMLRRCNDQRRPEYARYGGRGISVCERWKDIRNFVEDMGQKPEGMSLDRIDNDGPYSPDNCRWATRVEQANNKRSNRLLTIDGDTKTAAQWSRISGVSEPAINFRLKSGWPAKDAVFTGVRHARRA